MTAPTSGIQILNTPMQPNDAGADTIRGYLIALLATVWDEGEGFSGKRPFGNSSWDGELYEALAKAGHIEAEFDEDGYLDHCDDEKGRTLVSSAIQALTLEPGAASPPRAVHVRHGNRNPQNIYQIAPDGSETFVAVAMSPGIAENLVDVVNNGLRYRDRAIAAEEAVIQLSEQAARAITVADDPDDTSQETP